MFVKFKLKLFTLPDIVLFLSIYFAIFVFLLWTSVSQISEVTGDF